MSEIDKNESMEERTINDLRVCELKSELEKRGLDTLGVKVVLSVRLSKALREEGLDPNTHMFLVSSKGSPTKKIVKKAATPVQVEKEEVVEEKVKETEEDMDESLELRIVDDPEDSVEQIKIEQESEQETNESVQQKEENEEKEEEIVTESVAAADIREEIEDVKEQEEDVEGEDEFEEIAEIAENEEEQVETMENVEKEDEDVLIVEEVVSVVVEKTAVSQSPNDEEIFLDEEDMLEDPLDEQLAEPATKKPAAAPAAPASSATSSSSLFGDESKKTSIWIRGMTPSTKASSVKQLASPFGKVTQSKIFNSKPVNGEIKNCFALVTFADEESMDAAITALHRTEHEGRTLRVEKVADSNLTGSAERIAKEKKEAERKKKEQEEAKNQEPKKKREIIQPPEDTKRKERQTIQAPEKSTKSNRAVIQAPERSRSREKEQPRRERQPIVYQSTEKPTDKRKNVESSSTRDARKIISAPRGVRITPPPNSNSRGRHETSSLIISARVDTSGCKGGVQRSVERSVRNNITTSELRRNNQREEFSRRVEYPNQSYQTTARRQKSPIRPSNAPRSYTISPIRQNSSARRDDRHESRDSRGSGRREPEIRGRSPDRDRERRSIRTAREQEMLDMLRRKEDEHRIREEELRMEKKREQLRFEAEKLERTRLELELKQQKLALQEANMMSSSKFRDSGRGDERGGSRRRQADNFSPPARPPKVHSEDRRGGSRHTSSRKEDDDSGRHGSIPSARHVATEYGIQSGGGGSMGRMNYHSATSNKGYEQRQSASSSGYRTGHSYDTSSLGGGSASGAGGYQYQVPASARFQDTALAGYQPQVWGGLDANGQMTMETHWTADSASASTSSSSNQWQYPNTTGSNRTTRDYGYRNNY